MFVQEWVDYYQRFWSRSSCIIKYYLGWKLKIGGKFLIRILYQIKWPEWACVKKREEKGGIAPLFSVRIFTKFSCSPVSFSRETKELSGEALSRVGLEKWLTWQPVVLIIDDDDKVMMMLAVKDNGDGDDEADSTTFFSRWNVHSNLN